jgi:UPF0716 family protein affecting phage T7 exclusion
MGHRGLTFVAAVLVLVSGAVARIIYVQLLHPSTSATTQATDLYYCCAVDVQQQTQLPLGNPYGLDLEARRDLPKG